MQGQALEQRTTAVPNTWLPVELRAKLECLGYFFWGGGRHDGCKLLVVPLLQGPMYWCLLRAFCRPSTPPPQNCGHTDPASPGLSNRLLSVQENGTTLKLILLAK